MNNQLKLNVHDYKVIVATMIAAGLSGAIEDEEFDDVIRKQLDVITEDADVVVTEKDFEGVKQTFIDITGSMVKALETIKKGEMFLSQLEDAGALDSFLAGLKGESDADG